MRVGIDISPIRRPRTGVGNYCYYLLKHLLEAAPDMEFRGFASGTVPVDLNALEGKIGYRYLHVPTRALYALTRFCNRPRVDGLLGGLDVYHGTNYYLLPTRTARRVMTIHDLSFLTVPEASSPRIRQLFARSVPEFARVADAVIACSESTRRDVIRYCDVEPEKVSVIYEAVDEALVPWEREAALRHVTETYGIRAPYILFVGTLEPRKNLPALIRAFSRIAREVPHTLVLAGPDGWGMEAVYEAIADSTACDRIQRPGYVAGTRDLAALYSAADAFLFPSLYEGFGLPLLEAMTCGCPVICANNSSMPEVAGDAAIQVDAGDVDALATAMTDVLENRPLWESLVRKGYMQAAGFSWAKCAAQTAAVYQQLAGK